MENNILLSLQEIFRDVLNNDEIVLITNTTSSDIEEWDSLNHIQLIFAIEKKYNIKFTAKEMLGWNNVGEMVSCILQKQNS
jgi:Acyl carrier protein